MKNMFKSSIWLAMIVLATISKAGTTGSPVEIRVTGERTFSVSLSMESENVQVILKDMKGHALTRRTFRDGITTLNFDLNDMKNGQYQLEVIDNEKMETLPIDLAPDHLIVDVDKTETYFFPIIFQNGSKVTISKWAPEKEQIYVTVVNARNRLVHQDIIEGTKHLGKRFDFSQVTKGTYRMRVNCKNYTLSKVINIQ